MTQGGDGQRHVFDLAHVLTRVVEVEHPLRQVELAPSGELELQEGEREVTRWQ